MVQKYLYGRGSEVSFNDPSVWTPTGVPQPGDVAYILTTTVLATGTLPSALLISYGTRPNSGHNATLILRDATVPAGTTIDEYTMNDTYAASLTSSLQFAGTVVNNGTLIFRGGPQPVTLPSGTTLTNNGTIDVDTASPQLTAASTLLNNGLIRIVNTGLQTAQRVILGPAIAGTGTITVSLSSTIELGSAVTGQSLNFVGGANAGAAVQIDRPTAFAATIAGFVQGDTLTLANTAATSITYSATSPTNGTLQLFNGTTTPIAALTFSGAYTAANFALTASGSSLLITTSVTNPATGSTAAPIASGIYRFFDTTDGTHFYSASVSERDGVLINRSDLVEETNTFGTVTTPDTTTENVYRFFDTTHGTHFFTASTTERDTVIATRKDLVFEPSATFLEHLTPQPGDVAVYRLFSTTDGTHLYTGSPTELTALTTPGAPTYRPDLISEGPTFYAPSGTYT